jgi:hypothetical protein
MQPGLEVSSMPSWMEERDRLMAQTQPIAAAAAPAEKLTVAPATDAGSTSAPIATAAPPAALRPPVSERTDIQQRVAAFRARQARMNAEREAYYETMQAKIRRGLGNEPGSGRL